MRSQMPPSSRLQAPTVAVRTAATNSTASSATPPVKRGSNDSQTPSPGLRQPSAPRSRKGSEEAANTPPPRLSLHDLQDSHIPSPTVATALFLRRGSGRTIGSPSVSTPPRRKSGSPQQPTSTSTTAQPTVQLRSRGGSKDATAATPEQPRTPVNEATEIHGTPSQSAIVLHAQNPRSPVRQRKRSADMMDPHNGIAVYESADASSLQPRPLPPHPMTPPPRVPPTAGQTPSQAMALSPPEAKRPKRLTLSPKTPLGNSNYAPTEEGGLSASQRVRLSLSGYMTMPSLTASGRRDSFIHTARTAATISPPIGGSPSTSSGSRSRMASSRSLSATQALITSKTSLECMMGYMSELQKSEASLRNQLAIARRQREEDMAQSVAHVNSLEAQVHRLERERKEKDRQVQQLSQIVQGLMGEIEQIRQQTYAAYYAQQEQSDNDSGGDGSEYPAQWDGAYASPAPESHTTSTTYPGSGHDDGYPIEQYGHNDSDVPVSRGLEHESPHFVPANYEQQWHEEVQATSFGYPSAGGSTMNDFPPPSPMPTPSPVWMMAQSARRNEAPPAFSVAPRLSDVIAPLSQAQVFTPDTADHNVLKPVTPQSLGSGNQETKPVVSSPVQESPPPSNPLAFSVANFTSPQSVHSAVDDHQHPLRSGDLSTESPPSEIATSSHNVPVKDVFKPFQQLKLSGHKASASPSSSDQTPQILERLLVEFLTTVDKAKLHQAPLYAKRYRAENIDNLFAGLAKKYGAAKVADLKLKYEAAVSVAALPVAASPSQPRSSPSPRKLHVNPVAPLVDNPPVLQFSPDVIDQRSVFGSPDVASAQPFSMALAGHAASAGTPVHSVDSKTLHSVVEPPPSPTKKVSPTAPSRRGQPLPFAFAEESPLPPTVELTASRDSTSLMATPPPPVRMVPSPPREPPPSRPLRSPVRSAVELRQRVSPQKTSRQQPTTSPAGSARPLASPPKRLSPGGNHSPISRGPVTLESLLKEFYSKHQPDRLPNVPELVRQYTGRERELVASLKSKYGALNVKRLEQHLPELELKCAALTGRRRRGRGCFGTMVIMVATLCTVVIAIAVTSFGGLLAVTHSVCSGEGQTGDASTCGDEVMQAVDAFELERMSVYASRLESKRCFCDAWVGQEKQFLREPSVRHGVSMVKLSVLSRSVVEPVATEFVATYLPDSVPFLEYFHAYAVPVLRSSVEAAVTGYKHSTHIVAMATSLWSNELQVEDGVATSEGPMSGDGDESTLDVLLTKAAMASKSLAEPRKPEDERVDEEEAAELAGDVDVAEGGEEVEEKAEASSVSELVVKPVGEDDNESVAGQPSVEFSDVEAAAHVEAIDTSDVDQDGTTAVVVTVTATEDREATATNVEQFEEDVVMSHNSEAAHRPIVVVEDVIEAVERNEATNQQPVEEVTTTLEDPSGLDPLELLDLADLAAAAMYSME